MHRNRISQRQIARHAAKTVVTILLADLDHNKMAFGINMGYHPCVAVCHNCFAPTFSAKIIGLLQAIFAQHRTPFPCFRINKRDMFVVFQNHDPIIEAQVMFLISDRVHVTADILRFTIFSRVNQRLQLSIKSQAASCADIFIHDQQLCINLLTTFDQRILIRLHPSIKHPASIALVIERHVAADIAIIVWSKRQR